MSLEKIFRSFIFLYFLQIIITLIFVPEDPQYEDLPLSFADIAGVFLYFLHMLCIFALLKYSSIARTIFTVTTLIIVVLCPFLTEPTVPNGNLIDILTYLGGFINGSIIILIYLTDLSDKFKRA